MSAVKVHPMHKNIVALALLAALALGLTACTPDQPDSLSDECAERVMHRMLDGRDDDITTEDIYRYTDEECEVAE